MLSDEDILRLNHVLTEIEPAETFIGDMTYEEFRADKLKYYAVVRCLEIISEASRRLSAELKARHPDIDWRAIAGAGNVYRHDYEYLLDRQIWETAKGLHDLRTALARELSA